MKNCVFIMLIWMVCASCSEVEPEEYLNTASYQLHQASDFDYSGVLTIAELRDGNLEFTIKLDGPPNNGDIDYLTHLHFGPYDEPDAEIALVLNPVEGSTLRSTTVLPVLTDGTKLTFEGLQNFSGNVKIHLDKEGPDYQVILAAGNIGSSATAEKPFNANDITMCKSEFP